MARRWTGHMHGERYLGNAVSREVHDLDRETRNCRIDRIISGRHDVPLGSLEQAHAEGGKDCNWCLSGGRC